MRLIGESGSGRRFRRRVPGLQQEVAVLRAVKLIDLLSGQPDRATVAALPSPFRGADPMPAQGLADLLVDQ